MLHSIVTYKGLLYSIFEQFITFIGLHIYVSFVGHNLNYSYLCRFSSC
jgi:hypothetical protein